MTDSDDIEHLREQAEAGDAKAQYRLGMSYLNGDGVPEDKEEAVYWFQLAAEQGHVIAQFNLGLMYERGLGVPQDEEEAIKWYRKAAKQGMAEARRELKKLSRKANAKHPPLAVIFISWFLAIALVSYCTFEWESMETEIRTPKTHSSLLVDARAGDLSAQYEVGENYALGKNGAPQDDKKAVYWFRLAAERGLSNAEFRMGEAYLHGYGVTENIALSAQYFCRAAKPGIFGGHREAREAPIKMVATGLLLAHPCPY